MMRKIYFLKVPDFAKQPTMVLEMVLKVSYSDARSHAAPTEKYDFFFYLQKKMRFRKSRFRLKKVFFLKVKKKVKKNAEGAESGTNRLETMWGAKKWYRKHE